MHLHPLKLDLCADSGAAEDLTFQGLTLSRLKNLLLLDSGTRMSIYNIAPIISLLHRSSSRLKCLSINTWLQEDKLDLLHCALIATHLEIREHVRKPIITDEVLQTLNIPSASDSAVFLFPTGITGRTILLAPPLLLQHQILLPALVPALDVEPAFKDDVLIDMIQSRWRLLTTTFDLFSEADAKTKRARLRKFSLKRATGTIR